MESLLLRVKRPSNDRGSDSEYLLVEHRASEEVKGIVAAAFTENPTLALIARTKIA